MVAALAAAPALAHDHGPGSWINRQNLRDPQTGQWCCDERDTRAETDNIEAVPGAAQEVIARTGKRAIPQFVIDGKWVQPYAPGEGFLYEKMSELLGIE